MRRRHENAVALVLVAAAYALAFLQRPGWASSDTKINLHVDPGHFLGQVAHLWTPTGSLGHIHGAQHTGYLFPMGPFFALFRELGLGPWVVERLWLGTVLALAAWGVVKLLDSTLPGPRGVPHLAAGAFSLLNPLVVVFGNRTSVFLLSYAALPWALWAVRRGLHERRGWRWAALLGLVITASGGGVNAASVAWVLVGPALLLLYEPRVTGLGWRHTARFAGRCALAVAAASIWWAAPVVGHALYGIDFLQFTEQAGTIWNTTSLPESLRLMGYWISYLGVGYGDQLQPYFSDSPTLLFDLPVVIATLLAPALAIAGLVWTRRWRYAPFFLALLLLGLLAMSAGFPEGTPLRRALTFTYNRVDAVQFLRTTYKAGPLVAIAVACLGGAALGELARRLRGRRPAQVGAALAGAVLIALCGWPLITGDGLDPQLTWKRIPAAWTSAAHGLDRELPRDERAVVLPGQPFAFYTWGGTVDPILPVLTDRPVAVRNTPPYSDLHAVDMLWTVDGLIQQRRLFPGQLPPLLDLMAVGAVVTGSDDDTSRSGAMPPADAAGVLSALGKPAASYGPSARFSPSPEQLGPAVSLPQVRRYDVPGGRGIVRVEPRTAVTVVDGSAEGLAGLAAFGALPARGSILYAGDSDAGEVRRAAAAGAELVVTDSNRRRVFVASRTRQTTGATLAADDPISEDAALLDPFPGRGPAAQTVATVTGARYVRAPLSPGFAQFPEQRPYAAFDGDTSTGWLADPSLDVDRHYVEVGFQRPRAVDSIELLPYPDRRARVTEVEVAGKRFPVRPGWNRLRIGARRVSDLRVRIVSTDPPKDKTDAAGGISEIRVPGLHVRERLRPPRLVTGALATGDVEHSGLTYLMARTTGDEPFSRDRYPATPGGPKDRDRAEEEAALVRGARDPERSMSRVIETPAARSFTAEAWTSLDPEAPDTLIDGLEGRPASPAFTSSSRYRNAPSTRAARAFDGDQETGWVGDWVPGAPAWVAWTTRRPATLRRLTLHAPAPAVRVPTRVRLRWSGGSTPPLEVGPGGAIELPRPVRARSFRLEVLAAEFPPRTPDRERARTAVGIGELSGAGVPRMAAGGGRQALRGRCGDAAVAVDGRRVPLRPAGTVANLEAGRPLRARECGPAVGLSSGRHELGSDTGRLLVDLLRLRSPAPNPIATIGSIGRVTAPGDRSPGSYRHVQVRLTNPSWLVLGESYNRGWRATCDGRSLGAPRVIDGFANGWPAPASCRDVDIDFAPQKTVTAALWIGGLAGLALLAIAIGGWIAARRRGVTPAGGEGERVPAGPPPLREVRAARLPVPRAIAIGVVAAAVFGFVFALRAGVLVGPAVALLLWRGVGVRALILAAGGLLAVVVPLIYLVFPAEDRGGYNPEYALDLLGAHWVAVGAFALLAVALGRMLSTARAPSAGPAPPPP